MGLYFLDPPRGLGSGLVGRNPKEVAVRGPIKDGTPTYVQIWKPTALPRWGLNGFV